MVIDIKIKPKRLQPRPPSPNARPAAYPFDHCILESECIYNGLNNIFCKNRSTRLYTNRHIICKHLFMDTKMGIHTKITNLLLTTITILPLYFCICVIIKYYTTKYNNNYYETLDRFTLHT